MEAFLALVPAGVIQAGILTLVALGILIPFRILGFADLTGEGSYPFGAAVSAALLVLGAPPVLAMGGGALAGGLLGLVTATAHLYLKVNTLLAGIIVSTMAWSLDLRLLGAPNVALFGYDTVFGSTPSDLEKILLLGGVIIVLTLGLFLFLHTGKGLRLRAQGVNPAFAARQGIHGGLYVGLGLFLGNALVGSAGALMVQLQGYVDVSMGLGMVIHALAALMIGEGLVGRGRLARQLCAPLVGALLYQQLQGLVLSLGLAPSDLKFVTGAIALAALGYAHRRGQLVG